MEAKCTYVHLTVFNAFQLTQTSLRTANFTQFSVSRKYSWMISEILWALALPLSFWIEAIKVRKNVCNTSVNRFSQNRLYIADRIEIYTKLEQKLAHRSTVSRSIISYAKIDDGKEAKIILWFAFVPFRNTPYIKCCSLGNKNTGVPFRFALSCVLTRFSTLNNKWWWLIDTSFLQNRWGVPNQLIDQRTRQSPHKAINFKIYLFSCLLTCSFDNKSYLRDLLRFITSVNVQKGWQSAENVF